MWFADSLASQRIYGLLGLVSDWFDPYRVLSAASKSVYPADLNSQS